MNFAQLLFPDFSLIALGWIICRYTALDRRVWDQVESLVYYFLFPVLLFHSIVRSPLDFTATSRLLAAGLGVALGGIALAYLLPVLPGWRTRIDRAQHAAGAQVAFRFNSFICLAMAERLGGAEGLLLIAVLIGVCVPLCNVAAVYPMARHAEAGLVRQLLRNPLIIATLSGLLLNLAGLRLPAFMEPVLVRIGGASLALGLLAAGAGMQFASLASGKLLAASLLTIRHLLLPLLAAVLARALQLPPTQAAVLLAFAAVPTASSAYVLAARMGHDGGFVAALVTLSTGLGVLSLPFALSLVP